MQKGLNRSEFNEGGEKRQKQEYQCWFSVIQVMAIQGAWKATGLL